MRSLRGAAAGDAYAPPHTTCSSKASFLLTLLSFPSSHSTQNMTTPTTTTFNVGMTCEGKKADTPTPTHHPHHRTTAESKTRPNSPCTHPPTHSPTQAAPTPSSASWENSKVSQPAPPPRARQEGGKQIALAACRLLLRGAPTHPPTLPSSIDAHPFPNPFTHAPTHSPPAKGRRKWSRLRSSSCRLRN